MSSDPVLDGPIVGVGELLWDMLPDGPHLGGAPFNVLVHLRRLGWATALVSAVGDDAAGVGARTEVERLGVGSDWVQTRRGVPTGSAIASLDDTGSPTFEISRPAAYDRLDLDHASLTAIAGTKPSAIVLGTLAQQSASVRAATRGIIEACPGSVRLYDANLREGCWDGTLVEALLFGASIIKLNEAEADVVARLAGWSSGSDVRFGHELARETGARAVCVTRGHFGARLWIDDLYLDGAPPSIEVSDAAGAGDAFAAGLLDGLLADRDGHDVLRQALALGSLVASRPGATPAWTSEELRDLVGATPIPRGGGSALG